MRILTDGRASSAFVGRDEELARLRSAYVQAVQSRPVLALVSGEAGIGKTRLVEEFAQALPERACVLWGRCVDLGAEGLPFAPFASAFRRLVRDRGVEAITTLLPESGCGGLMGLLPELAGPSRSPASGAAGDPAPGLGPAYGRTHLFGEIATLFERLAAQQPVVLILEDLHWADGSSRALLSEPLRLSWRP
ncbi:ATP-binding protein [Thermoactinospora rubra]|uniref:ATP-binding protein n=1 Tax=Thermoactinospora rubra TaxID=1088767 RepID=UPI001301DBBF|nr:ATP-binding protein [Thermoactinospora rubra]